MKYLLDTNICIYIINEKPRKVLRKFEQYPVHEFGISSITHAELQYGIAKSRQGNRNQVALDEFLLPLTILPFYGKRGNLILRPSGVWSDRISASPPTKRHDARKKALNQSKMRQTAKKRKHRSPGKRISIFSGQTYVVYSRATQAE